MPRFEPGVAAHFFLATILSRGQEWSSHFFLGGKKAGRFFPMEKKGWKIVSD